MKANHAAKLKDDAVGEDEGAHGGVLPLKHRDDQIGVQRDEDGEEGEQ